MADIEMLRELREESPRMLKIIQEEALSQRFLIGSHNAIRLKKSLAAVERLDLDCRTLLTPSVHAAHAKRLNKRFQAKWTKLKAKADSDWKKLPRSLKAGFRKATDDELSSSHFRFLTVVDSVTMVDANSAFKASAKLREKLTTTALSVPGISVLGAIEIEVISMRLMREIKRRDKQSQSEARKLDVCEALEKELTGTLYSNEDSLLLVHFHGVVTAKLPSQFDEFYKKLQKVKQWSLAGRQIELKTLSREYGGRSKSVDKNLEHIAIYITKGGNDWYGKKAYLRYKIGFENEDVMDETMWVAKSWRRDELLRHEHAEDGIEDMFSLTACEIGQLAIVIDRLMSFQRNRAGYLVSVSW